MVIVIAVAVLAGLFVLASLVKGIAKALIVGIILVCLSTSLYAGSLWSDYNIKTDGRTIDYTIAGNKGSIEIDVIDKIVITPEDSKTVDVRIRVKEGKETSVKMNKHLYSLIVKGQLSKLEGIEIEEEATNG